MKPRIDPPSDRIPGEVDPAVLESLVSRALELRDEGHADWLAQACRADPGAEAAVRAAIERVDSLPGWIDRSVGHDPLRGQRLGGRFRLIERIGAGAMGVVYLAEDLELRRNVACKLVHHGLMPPEQALERFAREAQAMAAVQHPAVATIHDRGRTDGGQVFIVMELVDGSSLTRFLEAAAARTSGDDAAWIETELGVSTRGETSLVRTVVRWIADLAGGLEAVHHAGVLHRDIKPSNILLRRDGRPALLDFGIALLDEQGSGTRTGTSVGTPTYMPPEALHRGSVRTPASDVYSLAATLYHLLTLHAPYEGSPTAILAQLATADPVPAAKRRPGLPRDLQAVLDQGMHRNPARRYASAAAFEADLRAFLEFRPVAARPITAVERGMRRLARSRAAVGALAALTLVALTYGAQAWREHRLDVRRARHAELAKHFPPNFSILGPANRVYRHEADREALRALLDEAAEVAVEPLPTRLLRASFRQDHGDPDGAASDMSQVADFVGSRFARELAARYASAPRETRGAGALDLEGLPAPGSPVDRYLLAYHLLRGEDIVRTRELLADPEVRRIPHAEEMFLATTDVLSLRGNRAELRRLAVERFADLVRLESRIGGRTATTAHLAGGLLSMQDRYDEAIRICEEGIELAPRAYILRSNAGYYLFAEGRTAEAREHLEIARDLRPNFKDIARNLVWVEIADRHFDVAMDLVRDTGPKLAPSSPGWVDYWSGFVATYAALDAHAVGDTAERARQLDLALGSFERVPAQVLDDEKQPADTAYRTALALANEEPQALVLALIDLVAEEPQIWWRRQVLLRHLPTELDARATAALRLVLEALDTRTTDNAPK